MSTQSNESKGPVILFFLTWMVFSTVPIIEEYAFLASLALMAVGYATVRMISHATFRMRGRAWWLLAQLTACCVGFLYFAPLGKDAKFFILWSCGTPLVLLGGISRALYERLPRMRRWIDRTPPVLCGLIVVVAPIFSWTQGGGFVSGLLAGSIICGLGGIPLYYGWRFAEPVPRAHDAGFGSAEFYRTTGMSDER